MLRYTFMIDVAYLYHRYSNSQSGSPHSYVLFQIQQTISHEDIAFHENSMGPMYQISIVFSLTLRQPLLYHQLYMIGSCILEHRSNYYFDIVTSIGMPALSIYMSHIICISPIDGNHINTKTKSHHAPSQEATSLRRKSYDVCRPYDELLPSHIRGQSVNRKNTSLSSTWPTPPKDTHARPSFDPILTPTPSRGIKNIKKGLKNP